jgi:hypothetical protein
MSALEIKTMLHCIPIDKAPISALPWIYYEKG